MASRKRKARLPHFRSEDEEADFWDTHDVTDFLNELPPEDVTAQRKPKNPLKNRI